jgi:hypothetical protein
MKINEISENISHTSKRLRDIERNKGVKPGTEEWSKLWFSLSYLKESAELSEGYKIQLERDPDMYVLHITDTKSGKRTEVRGKSGYESGSYDADDRLHQLLDKIGKSANISELINGEVVTINPKHPDATKAKKAADKAFNEEVEISLHGDAEKGYVLSKIEVSSDERNSGQGTKAMQDIVDRMDREGAIIALTPDDAFGGNKNRLTKFYKRFGFVPNKGRNKDFRFRETMIRYPKKMNEEDKTPDMKVSNPPKWKRTGPDGEIEIKFPSGRRFKIEKQYDENIRHRGEWKVLIWDEESQDWEWGDTFSPKAYAKQMVIQMGQYDEQGKQVADYSHTFQFESSESGNDPVHPEVVKAYIKTLDADHNHAEYQMVATKRQVTRSKNVLSKKIAHYYPGLDSRGKIALYTKLQNLHTGERQ